MSYYRLSAEAQAEDIWLYLALDSPEAADRFIDTLANRIALIATQARMGRTRDELAQGLRSFPVKSYVIFYRGSRTASRLPDLARAPVASAANDLDLAVSDDTE